MTDSLRRACLLRGSSTPTTTSVALAAAIAAAATGVAEAQAQTPPRGNVRVILSPGDVLPGQRFPLNTNALFPARISDAGVIDAFVGQSRSLVMVSASSTVLLDPLPSDIPPGSVVTPFTTAALATGSPSRLSIRLQSGSQIGSSTLRAVYGGQPIYDLSLAPTAANPATFYDSEVSIPYVLSGVLGQVAVGLWAEERGEFVSVARRGDPAPGFESIGGRLLEPSFFQVSTESTAVYSADVVDGMGVPANTLPVLFHRRAGLNQRLFAEGHPFLESCPSLAPTNWCSDILEPTGDVIVSTYFPSLTGHCGPSNTYQPGLLRARPGSYEWLVDANSVFPDGRSGARVSYSRATGRLTDGAIVLHASLNYIRPEYLSGLWLVRGRNIDTLRNTNDPLPFPEATAAYDWAVAGVADDDTVYYLVKGYEPPQIPPRVVVSRWRNGTNEDLYYSPDGAPGIDASCRNDVSVVGIDPRGAVIVHLVPFTCSLSASTPVRPRGGLYRIAESGPPTPLLIQHDTIALPDGSSGEVDDVRQTILNEAATNRFGQMLASVTVVGHADPYLVLLETTALCREDYNADGVLDPDDLGDYITAFFGPHPTLRADVDEDGVVTTNDLGDYITNYFAGCTS